MESGFYDVVLVAINFAMKDEERTKILNSLKRAHEAGVGVVAMKTQAKGGYNTKELGDITPHQAALKWTLQHDFITTAIPGMTTFEAVEENAAVMNTKMTWIDRRNLYRYAKLIDKSYCRMCDQCADTCPKGVAISDNMRFLMYAEGYGDLELGRSHYRSLSTTETAAACMDCTKCVAKCVNGLAIAERMRLAHTMLA